MRSTHLSVPTITYPTKFSALSGFGGCYEPEDVYIGILTGYRDALNAGRPRTVPRFDLIQEPPKTRQKEQASRPVLFPWF
jgi:hypothetical protein